jgi:hypothetical protein
MPDIRQSNPAMSMNMHLDNAAKKAYEVSYALFRVAAILPSRALAEILEMETLELLRAAAGGMPTEAGRALTALTYLVSFGKDTGKINSDNAELLLRQLEVMGSVLSDLAAADDDDTPRADLTGIFTEDEPTPVYLGSAAEESPATENAANDNAANENAANENAANGKDSDNGNSVAAGKRQELILGKIRRSGNCRTRDLQEVLPGVSERTLRYDLQRLLERGSIERFGKGGPASWYRVSL